MTDTDFLRQIEGFSLTTAEILYRLPDHPRLLQSYIWQDYDLAPRFPKLTDFLGFLGGESRRRTLSRPRRASAADRATRVQLRRG